MTDTNTLHLSLGPDRDDDAPRPSSPSSSSSRSGAGTSKPAAARHPTYYIPSGDVVFQVQETLFKVHRYFFERESPLFRDMLALPTPSDAEQEGLSDENPIQLPQVESTDFANFLWVFYNPTYSLYATSVDAWSGILRLAHRWQFPNVRELAFRELDRLPGVDAVRRLALAERYDGAPTWRAKAMLEIGSRREPLSVTEGHELGLEVVVAIAELRERMGANGRRGGHSEHHRHRRHTSRSRSRTRSRSPHIVRVEPTPEPHPPPPIIVQQPPQGYYLQPPYPASPTMYGSPGIVPVLPTVDEPNHEAPWVLPPSTFDQPSQRGRALGRVSKFFRSVLGRS